MGITEISTNEAIKETLREIRGIEVGDTHHVVRLPQAALLAPQDLRHALRNEDTRIQPPARGGG